MDRMEQVKHLRTDPGGRHYNCAQSILVPFAGEVGLGEEQAYQLGAMFGSGMNHGATCGVITSALMLLGLKATLITFYINDPDKQSQKAGCQSAGCNDKSRRPHFLIDRAAVT